MAKEGARILSFGKSVLAEIPSALMVPMPGRPIE